MRINSADKQDGLSQKWIEFTFPRAIEGGFTETIPRVEEPSLWGLQAPLQETNQNSGFRVLGDCHLEDGNTLTRINVTFPVFFFLICLGDLSILVFLNCLMGTNVLKATEYCFSITLWPQRVMQPSSSTQDAKILYNHPLKIVSFKAFVYFKRNVGFLDVSVQNEVKEGNTVIILVSFYPS